MTASSMTVSTGTTMARAVWFLPFFALLLYFPYLNAGYFSDDFLFYYNSPPAHLYSYFSSTGAVAHAYRPLEAIVLTIIQERFAFQTWPIHALAVSALMILCALVIAAAARLGYSPAEGALAGALVLVTQVGPPAVLGNDTLSQAMSSLLGFSSVFLFCSAFFKGSLERRPHLSTGRFWLSVLCFTASLFFKETALGFSLILCAIAYAATPRQNRLTARIAAAVTRLIPFGLAGIVYLAARIHAGGEFGSEAGGYKMRAGSNVIQNLALFAAGAVSPVSSVSVTRAGQTGGTTMQAIAVAVILLIAAAIVWGIVATPRKQLVLWLLGCSLAALFPAFLLPHVSELYFFNAVPFAGLLFGLALGSLWKRNVAAKAAAIACVALLIGGQTFACIQKSSLMRENGRRASALVSGLAPRIRSMPDGGHIFLVQPPGARLKYSVYLLEGFDVLEFGASRLGDIFGRPDVEVSIVEDQQARASSPDFRALLLGLDGNALRVWTPLGP
ncbi:MAG TPA: hypothetical protein VG273_15290 [Bryobacteraceae bacterium]|jgi:hypothetical protein|nr:hypothetical protein [Bryobacteraceae bacterium]